MKKRLKSALCIITLICLFIMPFQALATTSDLLPEPTKTIEKFVIRGIGSRAISKGPYLDAEDVSKGTFSQYIVASFDITFTAITKWSSFAISIDNSNNQQGCSVVIAGPSNVMNNCSNLLSASQVGIFQRKLSSSGSQVVAAKDTGVMMKDFLGEKYRFIIKRVIGEQNTDIQVYYFNIKDGLPSEPTLSYSVNNAEYGAYSKSFEFLTWETLEATIDNFELYNTDIDITKLKNNIEIEDDTSSDNSSSNDSSETSSSTSSLNSSTSNSSTNNSSANQSYNTTNNSQTTTSSNVSSSNSSEPSSETESSKNDVSSENVSTDNQLVDNTDDAKKPYMVIVWVTVGIILLAVVAITYLLVSNRKTRN